jgi:hypothetical protein
MGIKTLFLVLAMGSLLLAQGSPAAQKEACSVIKRET